ncbi:MAG: hypothetical protein NUV50_00325 [Rhodospirillales bacterium]|nr:hypothetical protein [Rhodospirillales bacterium]
METLARWLNLLISAIKALCNALTSRTGLPLVSALLGGAISFYGAAYATQMMFDKQRQVAACLMAGELRVSIEFFEQEYKRGIKSNEDAFDAIFSASMADLRPTPEVWSQAGFLEPKRAKASAEYRTMVQSVMNLIKDVRNGVKPSTKESKRIVNRFQDIAGVGGALHGALEDICLYGDELPGKDYSYRIGP